MKTMMIVLMVVLVYVHINHAAFYDWHEGTQARDDGATRDYYNRDGRLSWKNYMGDWRDADNKAQGDNAYAAVSISDNDTPKWVEWDVTSLAQAWAVGTYVNKGVFLRPVGGGGSHRFRSKEYADSSQRPQLVITTSSGSTTLTPSADTYLEPSTYQCMGDVDNLRAGGSNNGLLRFDLTSFTGSTITKAMLRLYDYAQYGSINALGVFRSDQGHEELPSNPILGIAANYIEDGGIANDPDVLFFADFESAQWDAGWSSVGNPQNGAAVTSDPGNLFQPFRSTAVRSRIPQGSNGGMTLSYTFSKEGMSDPEEVFFRYYLRLGNNWNPTIEGGKLPGISGTYGVAGWGGRKVDGTNGWSARGLFKPQVRSGNPLGEKDNPVGFYCYHADMPGTYGDNWFWTNDYRGYLENNRWYAIEQYAKMNTPTQNDGILRTWVDGRLAFEKTDIRFRDVTTLKIEKIWMNVYHGGKQAALETMDLYMDNVVIAKKYIGPITSPTALPHFGQGEMSSSREVTVSPNPVTLSGSIHFSITAFEPRYIEIYNSQGDLVKKLFITNKDKSHYRASWNGEDASHSKVDNGLYFFRVVYKGSPPTAGSLLLLR